MNCKKALAAIVVTTFLIILSPIIFAVLISLVFMWAMGELLGFEPTSDDW